MWTFSLPTNDFSPTTQISTTFKTFEPKKNRQKCKGKVSSRKLVAILWKKGKIERKTLRTQVTVNYVFHNRFFVKPKKFQRPAGVDDRAQKHTRQVHGKSAFEQVCSFFVSEQYEIEKNCKKILDNFTAYLPFFLNTKIQKTA